MSRSHTPIGFSERTARVNKFPKEQTKRPPKATGQPCPDAFAATSEPGGAAQSLRHGGQAITTARLSPATDKRRQVRPRRHETERHIRTVQVAIDEVAHSLLHHKHFCPQGADLPSYFVKSVVHDLLEQKENI